MLPGSRQLEGGQLLWVIQAGTQRREQITPPYLKLVAFPNPPSAGETAASLLTQRLGALQVTCGGDVTLHGKQEIIEFPWVVIDCKSQQIVDEKQLFVKPVSILLLLFCSRPRDE